MRFFGKWLVATAVVAATIALFAWYISPITEGSIERAGLLKANDRQIVALGAMLYTENCASCHGENLQGEADWQNRDDDGYFPTPPHDETGHTWHHDDALLFGITKSGIAKYSGDSGYKTRMPSYEDSLTDEEIIAVLSFIKAQWPVEIRQRHDEMNRINAGRSSE